MKKTAAFLTALAMLTGVGAGIMPMQELVSVADDLGDHGTQDTAAKLTPNAMFLDAVIEKGAENWYKLTTTEDGSFSLAFEHEKLTSSSHFWKMTAYQDVDGKLKEFKSWNVAGTDELTTSEVLGVPAGTYYIKVTQGDYYYSEADYTLTAYFTAGGWETEFNDTSEDADVISVNQPVNGLILSGTDTDWYTFSTEQDGFFTVEFLHDKMDSTNFFWQVTVYQEIDGKLKSFPIWDIYGNVEKTTTDALGVPAGNYYIRVTPRTTSSYSMIPYTMTVKFSEADGETRNAWETEFNDSWEDADPINVNQPYEGLTSSYEDVDWYTFDTEEDGHISVRFLHDRIDKTSNYWTITVYKYEDEKPKKFATYNVAANNEKFTTCNIGVPAGTYFVEIAAVSAYNTSTTPYEMTVMFAPNGEEGKNDWETEFNDYQEDADPINVDQSYNGSIYFSGDTDWYKFSLDAASSVYFRFEHDRLDSSYNYWTVELYQGNDKLNTWNIKGNEALTLSDAFELKAGEYHVMVRGANNTYYSTGDYTFRFGKDTGANPDDPGTTPDDPGTTEPTGVFGDFNNDGEVDASDAAILLVYSAEVGAGNTTLTFDKWLADYEE